MIMAYITNSELAKYTNIIPDDESEITDFISQAHEEFGFALGRTIGETEDIYNIVQRAEAYLTAYFVHFKRGEYELSKEMKSEYTRLIKIIMRNIDGVSEGEISIEPQFSSVEIE